MEDIALGTLPREMYGSDTDGSTSGEDEDLTAAKALSPTNTVSDPVLSTAIRQSEATTDDVPANSRARGT